MSVLSTDAAPVTGTGRSVAISRPLIALVVAQLLAGVAIGLLWSSWAPRTLSYLVSNGHGGSFVVPDESESQIAGDGRYVLLTLIAGLVFGLVGWRLRQARGPAAVIVLGAASVLSSLVARGTGELLSSGPGTVAINTAFHPALRLHATAAIWVQALFAVLVYTALVGLSSDPSLGRGQPAEPASTAARDGLLSWWPGRSGRSPR